MRKLISITIFVLLILLLVSCGESSPKLVERPSAYRAFLHDIRFASISSPVIGEEFKTSNGKWKNTPTSFTYQWERCNSSGVSCSNISGATSNKYTVVAEDEGHTLRVIVAAINAYGMSMATSTATGEVPASAHTKECFENPSEGTTREEECGFPGKSDTGIQNCSALTKYEPSSHPSIPGTFYENGTLTVQSGSAQTIEGYDFINVEIYVAASGSKLTFKKNCVIYDGHASLGSYAFNDAEGNEVKVEENTIRGANSSTESVSHTVGGTGTAFILKNNLLYNAEGPALTVSTGTVEGNFIWINAEGISGAHYDGIYCKNSTITEKHNTVFNIHLQTDAIFCETGNSEGACKVHLTLEENLLAGGGYVIYPCANATSAGGSFTIKKNRIARCIKTSESTTREEEGIKVTGKTCKEISAKESDAHGYFPEGGFFGVATELTNVSTRVWEGNVWDNNSEAIAEP